MTPIGGCPSHKRGLQVDGNACGLFLKSNIMPIKLDYTNGMNSRNRKLTDRQAQAIKRLYARGGRGKQHAARFKISPAHFNNVGRGMYWRIHAGKTI